MSRTPLMQRLLKLISTARKARKYDAGLIEYTDENFYSRRKFLETSVKATLAATMFAACSKKDEIKPNNNSSQPSIAIIGAGIAGLNAAFQLKRAGVLSTIYDANTRSGGRIFTAHNIVNPGISSELGGEFIDSGHHDVIALAKHFNLTLLDLYSPEELQLKQNVYYINNTFYSDADFLNALNEFLPAFTKDANSLSNKITYNHFSAADKRLDNMSVEGYFDSIGLTGWLRSLLLMAYTGEYGLNTDTCNAINFLYLFGESPEGDISLYGQSDERFRIKGGNQRVVQALTDELKNNIHLEHKLMKLKSDGDGFKLFFDNSKTIKANIVLLTLPFTLLRDVEIDADLPPAKINAIKNLSYGCNSKLLLGFNGRPWRSEHNSTGMCYTDNGIQNCWDSSQLQPGNDGGLTIFLGGDDAVALSKNSVTSQSEKYLPKVNEMFPGVDKAYNNKVHRMVWSGYPLAKASYSAWTVGQYTTIAGSEGETVGNLFFAGEHTSYNYQGYMNGGAASGRIAAENILEKIGE